MNLKYIHKFSHKLLQFYIFIDWLCHLANGAAINNKTMTGTHTQGPGPPTSVDNSIVASFMYSSNMTFNMTSKPHDINGTMFFEDSSNLTNSDIVPKDANIVAKNFEMAAHLEYGSQAYVIILLSTVVIVALIFTIFGLFMKAEAHSKSDIRSALLFDDKNLLSFSGIGDQGMGVDTTL